MVRVCKSNIIFPCVCHPPICPPRYLLQNHWAEFNQTCYMTFPHGKGVRAQYNFSVHSSFIHLSITLSPPKPLGRIQQTCYITSFHGKGVQEQHYFSLRPSSVHLSDTLSPPKPLGVIQPNLLHHFFSWLGCARAKYFSVHPSVQRPSICPSGYLLITEWNLTKLVIRPPLMVRVWESKSVHHAITNIRKEHGDLRWHTINCAF